MYVKWVNKRELNIARFGERGEQDEEEIFIYSIISVCCAGHGAGDSVHRAGEGG
jgi:hypothetical protein